MPRKVEIPIFGSNKSSAYEVKSPTNLLTIHLALKEIHLFLGLEPYIYRNVAKLFHIVQQSI